MARQYHVNRGNARKYKIIAKYGAYHGATDGRAVGRRRLGAEVGLRAAAAATSCTSTRRTATAARTARCYDGGACGITCADIVERTIVAEDPATVAAIIMEPISISSAGFVVPPPRVLHSCCASTATATTSC